MNVFSAIVNLGGKDAIVRYTPSNDAVTEFSVAVQSGYGDKQVTTWVNCTYWGKRGEKVAPYLTKGSRIGIVGELTNRPYKAKDGTEKHSLELRVSDLTLLGAKGDSNTPPTKENAPYNDKNVPKDYFDDMESDVPF
jgi:single-strand DNA-binding protein